MRWMHWKRVWKGEGEREGGRERKKERNKYCSVTCSFCTLYNTDILLFFTSGFRTLLNVIIDVVALAEENKTQFFFSDLNELGFLDFLHRFFIWIPPDLFIKINFLEKLKRWCPRVSNSPEAQKRSASPCHPQMSINTGVMSYSRISPGNVIPNVRSSFSSHPSSSPPPYALLHMSDSSINMPLLPFPFSFWNKIQYDSFQYLKRRLVCMLGLLFKNQNIPPWMTSEVLYLRELQSGTKYFCFFFADAYASLF
jgi:hypothetical protein